MQRALFLVCLVATSLLPQSVEADDLDVFLGRLRIADTQQISEPYGLDACSSVESAAATQMAPDASRYAPYNSCWFRLMSQLGMALAGETASPAHTTAPASFYLGFDVSMTSIDSSSYYWRRGTEGDEISSSLGEGENRFVPDVRSWGRLRMEKGLPFGFSLGGHVAYGFGSSSWGLGASVQFAPFEGFRQGVGYAPDLAFRGGMTTMVTGSDFNLTVPTVDIILSKPFVMSGGLVLTPIISGRIAWIIADSEVVDLTPGTAAGAECVPRTPYPCNTDPSLGPACRSNDICHQQSNSCRPPDGTFGCTGDVSDFANNVVFEPIRTVRAQLNLGVQARFQRFVMRASFGYDLVAPETPRRQGSGAQGDAPTADMAADGWDSLERQWTLNLGLGFGY